MTGPLHGKRVVNTRAPHQAAELDRLLQAQEAIPISYPCIDIAPPEDTAPLDEALRAAANGAFDWLVLTSANTVLSLSRRLESQGLPVSMLDRMRIAAVGPATAEAAQSLLGLEATILPDEAVAEALVEALAGRRGARVLLPQSDIARPVLAEGLTDAGLSVTAVVAYRTVVGSGGANLPALLNAGQIDAVTFTSSSTVENFIRRVTQESRAAPALGEICIACIGPIAAKTARTHGLAVAVIPEAHTLEGLVTSLETYFLEAREASWPTQS